MILTNCAACAAPLAHDAPRCVRCKLRYWLDNESVEDLTEGKKVLEDIYPRARRIMGAEHPFTMRIQVTLKMMRDHDI